MAGDFNVDLKLVDSPGEHITKRWTTLFLLEMMEDFYLINMAAKTQKNIGGTEATIIKPLLGLTISLQIFPFPIPHTS
jgi:hypothetical protein